MISISRAIKDINPNAEFSVDNDDYNSIQWHNETTPISVTDIKARQTLMKTRDAHIQPRKNAYPSIQQQLDMMWHDKQNDTTTWEDAIAKVKSDNPKVSE